jgi:hypothetical protein
MPPFNTGRNQGAVTKIANFKVGMEVTDRDYLCRGVGTVAKLLKTRVRINFGGELTTYDAAHCQFLRSPAKRKVAPVGRQ